MKKNWKLKSDRKKVVKSQKELTKILLENRGIKKSEEKLFFNPPDPRKIPAEDFGLKKADIEKFIERINKAQRENEEVLVYGDYDADGICGTAILWETLNELGLRVSPYIPERFSEGYGLNGQSIENLKKEKPNLKLIISVDNGIVAHDAVNKAKKLGVDVVITDHHEKDEKYPDAQLILHTTQICGSAISWVISREIRKTKKFFDKPFQYDGLDLAGIGTIADQVPLVRNNRSFAYWGLKSLNDTKRQGLLALFNEAAIKKGTIGSYEVGFLIAPRLNSTGRLTHAIESLRLVCMRKKETAIKQAYVLGKTNSKRQSVVDEVVAKTYLQIDKGKIPSIIILSDKNYHEGVIGLVASKLVEKFYRPAIVISEGKKISKASCRSIDGFDMIKNIRKLSKLIDGGGGHPMAAGFSIKTNNIKLFTKKMTVLVDKSIDPKMFAKKISFDSKIDLDLIDKNLINLIKKFEPTGMGNPTPTFFSEGLDLIDFRTIGTDNKHLKLVISGKTKMFDAIGFSMGQEAAKIKSQQKIEAVYTIDENNWNNKINIQLKIKDFNQIF